MSDKPTFTPGPFQVATIPGGYDTPARKVVVGPLSGHIIIADVHGAEPQALADARLFAAAPDMYAALQQILQAVCGPTGFASAVRNESGVKYPWPALDIAEAAARAALAKAAGSEAAR